MKHLHPAVVVASFVTFISSFFVLLIVDDRNDKDLLLAQCEANADTAAVVREAFIYLVEEYPGVSPTEINMRAYLAACLPERDCHSSLAPPRVPDICTVAGRETGG